MFDALRQTIRLFQRSAGKRHGVHRQTALIKIGQEAIPLLIEALEHNPQARVRANAARALALIADTSAIPALFRALEDESSLVQHWADQGLERMGVGQVYFKP